MRLRYLGLYNHRADADMSFAQQMKVILTPRETNVFARLNSPNRIQNFLDSLPINFESHGETYMSPRRVLTSQTAHCFEGALFVAAALAFHGHKPLLMDFQTRYDDEDHVVALFRQNGLWGAFSKTNHAILRYRDAVYKTPRELAMSYFHEYYVWDGRKSLRAYSAPFDVSRFAPERWVTANDELEWLVETLDTSKHFPIVSKINLHELRRASRIELRNLKIVEWKKNPRDS